MVDPRPGPAELAEADDDRAALGAAVDAGLRAVYRPHREAIRMRFFEGLTMAEAGRRVERTSERIRQLCVRGLELLKAELAAFDPDRPPGGDGPPPGTPPEPRASRLDCRLAAVLRVVDDILEASRLIDFDRRARDPKWGASRVFDFYSPAGHV
jgi:hypothetical protein